MIINRGNSKCWQPGALFYFSLSLLMVSRMCSCVCVIFPSVFVDGFKDVYVCLNQIGAANEIMPIRSYKWEVEEHQD